MGPRNCQNKACHHCNRHNARLNESSRIFFTFSIDQVHSTLFIPVICLVMLHPDGLPLFGECAVCFEILIMCRGPQIDKFIKKCRQLPLPLRVQNKSLSSSQVFPTCPCLYTLLLCFSVSLYLNLAREIKHFLTLFPYNNHLWEAK